MQQLIPADTALVELVQYEPFNAKATKADKRWGKPRYVAYILRRALSIAGAESQVISLWKVSDEGTKDLMVSYYQCLLNNVGRSDTLRQTQLEMLNSNTYQHPFYWAAFIPSGDWTPMEF